MNARSLPPLLLAGALLPGCGGPADLGHLVQPIETRPARLYLTAPVLRRLQERAADNDRAWTALQRRCDQMATGTMYPPSGPAYPSWPNIGQGYQGDSYLPAILDLGLCYRVVRGVDSSAEARYGGAGRRLLEAMSTPVGAGGQPPQTDSGYGIRNYGVGMATGFDWLYPALPAATRQRVITSLNAWIDWYDRSGFIRNDPIGNYFIGYLLAKTTAALATEGDNPQAPGYWDDVQGRMWNQLMRPKLETVMRGGGWPEGWGYGPRAVRGLGEFLWAVRTAKGLDWWSHVPQMREQATYQQYFSWPSLLHMDDQGMVHSGSPLRPSASLAAALAGLLAHNGDGYAAVARGFAADVIAATGGGRDAWQKLLYWDDSLPRASYTSQPLSYLAPGPGHLAVRSSWQRDAVWGSLVAGPYINATYSGEQYFNQGSLAVVRGDRPVLVNATGWLPQVGGSAGEEYVYDDTWGARTRRLYNTFFVDDADNIYNPGQAMVTPPQARTHIERYEEEGVYVRARGANIEDMYRGRSGAPVAQFIRDLVYLRPDAFVLFDRTTVAAAGNDQWLAFHAAAVPTAGATADRTQRRHDLQSGGATLGSVRALLPRNVDARVVALPSGLHRLEHHAPVRGAAQDWLTVVTAADAAPEQVRLSPADGNVQGATMVGVHLLGPRNQVVLFTADHAGTGTTASVRYTVRQTAEADHVLVDMRPGDYAVSATASGGQLLIDVRPGGALRTSSAGTLSFVVRTSGQVAASSTPTP